MENNTVERTPFMQSLMTSTYPNLAIEAIIGGFDGSWERLIAQQLRIYAKSNHSEAELILQANGGDVMKAAKMIINSKIPENVRS